MTINNNIVLMYDVCNAKSSNLCITFFSVFNNILCYDLLVVYENDKLVTISRNVI